MKKRNLASLALNKTKISELQSKNGGKNGESTNCPTASGCSCETCRLGCQVTLQPNSDDCTR